MKRPLSIFLLLVASASLSTTSAQNVDYSVVSVPEESGYEFRRITSDNDYLCMPIVKRSLRGINWLSNRIIDTSPSGEVIAYLSYRNNSSNIFIKDINKQGGSVQRTNRANVLDFSYSPDGKFICFSEQRGDETQIYRTDASSGYICRQITSGNKDYSPIYSYDMASIFFARQELNGVSIWSYNVADNFLSSYTTGLNPIPAKDRGAYICSRINSDGRGEIWLIDYTQNSEECIVSDSNRSFTTPTLSPDGTTILFVGDSRLRVDDRTSYYNTDLFICKIDGTGFTQLTYHAADDLSPVWGRDGKSIYFISQRGSGSATGNIWRMTYNE